MRSEKKGRPEGTLLREAGDLFLSLLLCSDKACCLPIKLKWEPSAEQRKRAVWASGLNLHVELRPAHLCYAAEMAKGVNDEVSERHLEILETLTQVALHTHNISYTELHCCIINHFVGFFFVSNKDFNQSPFKKLLLDVLEETSIIFLFKLCIREVYPESLYLAGRNSSKLLSKFTKCLPE